MNESSGNRARLLAQIEHFMQAAEQRQLTDELVGEFEKFLCDNAEARQLYAECVLEAVDLHRWAMTAQVSSQTADKAKESPGKSAQPTVGPLGTALQGLMDGLSNLGFSSLALVLIAAALVALVPMALRRGVEVEEGTQVAATPAQETTVEEPQEFVGRITAMVDCQWADPRTAPIGPIAVPLGTRYALKSGVLEISYDCGAKVILEGPAEFEIEARNGGVLLLGKLTAKLDELLGPAADDEPGEESTVATTERRFYVRTPTSTVIDLGTEFGVDVDSEGGNCVHVFKGKVQVEPDGADRDARFAPVLLEQDGTLRFGATGPVLHTPEARPRGFLRQVPSYYIVDVLDIVAGGDGSSWHRDSGINPASGSLSPAFVSKWEGGNGSFHRVPENPLVDGVFIPNGQGTAVQIDSTGGTFDGLGQGDGRTLGVIWSRSAKVNLDKAGRRRWHWVNALGEGTEYMPQRRGLLMMHANSGITFDLAEINRTASNARPQSFRTVAGAPRNSPIVFHVLVDGKPVYERRAFARADGTLAIDAEIDAGARFLTLAVSGGGETEHGRLVLGDPVIKMRSQE